MVRSPHPAVRPGSAGSSYWYALVTVGALFLGVAGCAEGSIEKDGSSDVGTADTAPLPADTDTGVDAADALDVDASDSSSERDGAGAESDGGDADAAPCGGRCGADQVCENGSCVDGCAMKNARCGTPTVGGKELKCGSCGSGEFCSGDYSCETVCDQTGAKCGSVEWGGATANCGSCSSGRECFHHRCVAEGYRSVAGGYKHSCASDGDGDLSCWGADLSEQLGNGSGGASKTPMQITISGTPAEVESLRFHSCALLEAGTTLCWGSNTQGQIGDGSSDRVVDVPSGVTQLGRASDVSVGNLHSCATLDSGGARCWGDQSFGRLGNGKDSTGSQRTPVKVKGMSSAAAIAVGGSHSCALKEDGSVWCWGNGSEGRLGNGSFSSSDQPVRVDKLEHAVDLAAGAKHTCAVDRDGEVWCWGFGGNYQLGDGSSSNRAVPVRAGMLDSAVAVTAGEGHTCARLAGGEVHCWGANVERDSSGNITAGGQLGDGTFQDSKTPKPVVPPGGGAGRLKNVVSLGAGRRHTCAVTLAGDAYCWGTNSDGQLGDGTTTRRNHPVAVQ